MAPQLTAPNTREVVDYMNLPPPVRYEELQRESMSAAPRSVHYRMHASVHSMPRLRRP